MRHFNESSIESAVEDNGYVLIDESPMIQYEQGEDDSEPVVADNSMNLMDE